MLYRIKVVRNNCQMQVCPGCSVDTWGRVSATLAQQLHLSEAPLQDAALAHLAQPTGAAGAAAWGSESERQHYVKPPFPTAGSSTSWPQALRTLT